MAKALLQVWTPWRNQLISQLDFYFEQANERLIAQFGDIEGEAETHGEETYRRLETTLDPEHYDQADAADMAQDQSIERYEMLSDMRRDVHLSVAAGLYHQWEKELRDWLSRELARSFEMEYLEPKIWSALMSEILDLLGNWGWDARALPQHNKIEACRLVVNVYKHGKGKALDALQSGFPEYLRESDDDEIWSKYADHTSLSVTADQLGEFHAAFTQFWQEIPENIFWDGSFEVPDWFEKAAKKANTKQQ
ncbi:hypothetical protein [Rhizobium tumorigenes]|uniref:Uncharacterized protein n=1 Tax=Rhizobium tumorigenes TaxID=2041385 RepID=A0AAF1KRE3_9HYPH|nr:hypothetical protein [Rhizobium tumorigenes]WFR96113.1 hypothetical protein PR017_02895 [Rhizobium tumorigenes]